jgi:hypothetical protein
VRGRRPSPRRFRSPSPEPEPPRGRRRRRTRSPEREDRYWRGDDGSDDEVRLTVRAPPAPPRWDPGAFADRLPSGWALLGAALALAVLAVLVRISFQLDAAIERGAWERARYATRVAAPVARRALGPPPDPPWSEHATMPPPLEHEARDYDGGGDFPR